MPKAHSTKNSLVLAKREQLKYIKDLMQNHPTHVFNTKHTYFVKIPLASTHKNHHSTLGHPMDKRLSLKIFDIVQQNLTEIPDVKRCLQQYVQKTLFPNNCKKPLKTNHKYYPSKNDTRNQVAKAIASMKHRTDNQECLNKRSGNTIWVPRSFTI